MSYESRILVANARRHTDPDEVFAEVVADMRLSNMGRYNGWRELFNEAIDFDVYVDGEMTREDKYGETLCEGDLCAVIDWLEKEMDHNDYRRLPLLLGLIKGIDTNKWEEIHVIHYGY